MKAAFLIVILMGLVQAGLANPGDPITEIVGTIGRPEQIPPNTKTCPVYIRESGRVVSMGYCAVFVGTSKKDVSDILEQMKDETVAIDGKFALKTYGNEVFEISSIRLQSSGEVINFPHSSANRVAQFLPDFKALTKFIAPSADESELPGFSSKPPAGSVVEKLWPTVFALADSDKDGVAVGAAILLSVVVMPDRVTADFLTSRHQTISKCRDDKKCPAAILAQDVLVEQDGRREKIRNVVGPVSRQIIVLRASKNPDLAVIRATFKKGTKLASPPPLFGNCEIGAREELWTVGFPWTPTLAMKLTNSDENDEIVRKRWTGGRLLALVEERHSKDLHQWYYTTSTSIHALQGNSGGPLFNSRGEVIGVLNGVLFPEEGWFDFASLGSKKYSSLFIPCAEVRSFVNQTPSVFKHTIDYE